MGSNLNCRVSCGMRIFSNNLILCEARQKHGSNSPLFQQLHQTGYHCAPIPMIMEWFAGTKTLYIVKCTCEGCWLEYPRNVISQDDLGGA